MTGPLYLPNTAGVQLSIGSLALSNQTSSFARESNGLGIRSYDKIVLLPGSGFSSNNSNSSGSVGINTVSPTVALDVVGQIKTSSSLVINASTYTDSYISLSNSSGQGDLAVATYAGQFSGFANAGDEVLRNMNTTKRLHMQVGIDGNK